MKAFFYSVLILIFFQSCDSTEPSFNPDKIFVEVKNGTLDSDGEFEVFNYSSRSIYIHYNPYSFCSFFTYSVEQLTDSGWIKLSFNEIEGRWGIPVFNPDSVYIVCDMLVSPLEVKHLQSYKQNITGINYAGEYRLTFIYQVPNNPEFYYLVKDYKVKL